MLIIANWKAYVEEAAQAKKLYATAKRLASASKHELVLAPPAPLLSLLSAKNRSRVAFSAQDVSASTGGAATGENTAAAYAAAGASYAIVGHSERRAMGETDATIALKLRHALAEGMTPVLCVGERERDLEGHYLSFVRAEITAALEQLEPKERAQVVLAYEPIWAIGKTAADAINPNDLAEMVLYLRKVLAELLPGKNPAKTRILYGGSVEPEGARDLAGGTGVDGFLVGHASVDPKTFSNLVRAVL